MHLIWSCPAAKDVWLENGKGIQKCSSDEVDFINIVGRLMERLKKEEIQRVAFVARQVWLRRNKYVFGEDLLSPAKVNKIATEQLELFQSVDQRPTRSSFRIGARAITRWEKPRHGWIKVNWDASIDKAGKRMGVGILARDHEGRIIVAMCAMKPDLTDPAVAEAAGAWLAVELSHQSGFSHVVLEGDSLEIVQWLRKDGVCRSRCGLLINETKLLLQDIQRWEVHHVKRKGNAEAHKLARLALSIGEDRL
ncbi:uncharacterized protein LOC132171299 [Corylus avellana]|uniref:uncharacterized protein LOC132171299 n=1 Tax=Corylus avellana TaxID=13451 RepID=UPI00286D1091|nr:uncharacterized protein LOC132171299 [Corylus avellana]